MHASSFQMSNRTLLTCNVGSSSIKLGLFDVTPAGPRAIGTALADLRRAPLTLRVVRNEDVVNVPLKAAMTDDLQKVIEEILERIDKQFALSNLDVVGHRVVHGGDHFSGATAISDDTLATIEALIPLAPLHQPHSVRLIRAMRHLRPDVLQVASFDTAFHRSQSDLVRHFGLPRKFFDEGVKRYGFHGLSYKYIAGELRRLAPTLATGGIVVLHLGSGCSLCGLKGGVSLDTSMAFSTLDGVPMATRCGALDPGVLLYLIKQRGLSIDAVEDLLYHKSGLLGLSGGISADTRELHEQPDAMAKEALAFFAFRIARELVATANTLGGLDGIVFTAGIGENQPYVRDAVCKHLAWLGVSDRSRRQWRECDADRCA